MTQRAKQEEIIRRIIRIIIRILYKMLCTQGGFMRHHTNMKKLRLQSSFVLKHTGNMNLMKFKKSSCRIKHCQERLLEGRWAGEGLDG